MILLAAPSPGELTSGGYLYNEYIASRLSKERFDYRYIDTPEQLYRLPKQLHLGSGDTVLVDSLFFHHPEAVERLVESYDGHVRMLIHCLPSSDPTLTDQETDAWIRRERRCLSICEGVVVTGKATERALYRMGLPFGSCAVASPGLDRRLFFPERGSEERASRSELQLLTVANWTPLKNHAAMLSILSEFAASEAEASKTEALEAEALEAEAHGEWKWRWRIVGKCDDGELLCGSFMHRAGELGIDGRIELLATQPVAEVARLTRTADIFLHPSLMESYGMSIAEAMAAGCVVIAGRNQGTAELIKDGENGILCDPQEPEEWKNAFRRLAKSPEERIRLSSAAVRSAELLPSWEDTAKRLREAVEGSEGR